MGTQIFLMFFLSFVLGFEYILVYVSIFTYKGLIFMFASICLNEDIIIST